MINIPEKDLGWIAGFLEGEGSFGRCGSTISVSASQVQKYPLEVMSKLVGGNLNTYQQILDDKKTIMVYHRWQVYGMRAVEVMLSIYHLMSPKRKCQIEKTLSFWVTRPGNNSTKYYCEKEGYILGDRVAFKNRVLSLINSKNN